MVSPKSCGFCGSEFIPHHNAAKYCDSCRSNICIKCHRPKIHDQFKLCQTCRDNTRAWRKAKPLYFRARDKAKRDTWRAAGKCQKCGKPLDSEYKTCSACRLVGRTWNKENPEKARAYVSKWEKKMRHVAGRCSSCGRLCEDSEYNTCRYCRSSKRAQKHNRRAAANGNGGRHTAADERELFNAQDFRCFYCNQPLFKSLNPDTRHIEHIVSISNGGSNAAFNIVRSCDSCNNDKVSKYNDDASLLLDALTDKGTITDAELKKSIINLSSALNDNILLRVWRGE